MLRRKEAKEMGVKVLGVCRKEVVSKYVKEGMRGSGGAPSG